MKKNRLLLFALASLILSSCVASSNYLSESSTGSFSNEFSSSDTINNDALNEKIFAFELLNDDTYQISAINTNIS